MAKQFGTAFTILATVFLLVPQFAFAQLQLFQGPLVSCGLAPHYEDCVLPDGTGGRHEVGGCNTCDLLAAAQKLINFFIFMGVVVATLLFTYAGILWIFSAANESNIEKAKKIFWNVLFGLVFVLGAWLIVDVMMKTFFIGSTGSGQWGPWNQILCTNPGAETTCTLPQGTVGGGGGLGTGPGTGVYQYGPGPLTAAQVNGALNGTAPYTNALTAYAQQNGVDPTLARAIMGVESSGQPGACSGAGACGLMQIIPATARGLDPAGTAGLTDAQIQEKLKDPNYSMQMGTKLLGQLSAKYNGDVNLIAAAYNGGDKANNASTVCPGQLAWQCAQNSGYAETRKYVDKVHQLQTALKPGV